MRVNKLRNMLQATERIICIGPSFPSPELIEYLGLMGFDCVFIDGEHGVIGPERTQELVRAADAVGMASLTRVPASDPGIILPYLETGTHGVLIPHVNTPDDVRKAVQAVRYPPSGLRGAHSGTRAANYGVTQGATEYFTRVNAEIVVAIMIEEVTALENLDAMLQVPGLDMCFLGPGDLSMSMGHTGQPGHPDVQAQVEQAFQKIRAAGIAAGTVAGDGKGAHQLFDRGFQVALVSVTRLLTPSLQTLLTEARAA